MNKHEMSIEAGLELVQADCLHYKPFLPTTCRQKCPKSKFFRNFKRPFTHRGWLGSARNFGKTRFRRFAIFVLFADFFIRFVFFRFGHQFFVIFAGFWRSQDFLIRVGSCVVKSYCLNCPYFWGDFLVEGVKDSICVFYLDLGPKMTLTIWWCDWTII